MSGVTVSLAADGGQILFPWDADGGAALSRDGGGVEASTPGASSFLEKLEAARMALSHSHPSASSEELLDAGLDLLLARDAKRKALVLKPREDARPTKTEKIPAAVRRAVWKRDGGKCQWKLASGELCGSTYRVQLDHIVPRALGGPSTIGNLRCLCGGHNLLAARDVLGDALMDRYVGARRRSTPAQQGPQVP